MESPEAKPLAAGFGYGSGVPNEAGPAEPLAVQPGGSGGQCSSGIIMVEAAQPVGLREPGGFCDAELSIPSSGRASPSLRRGWTTNRQKHKLNHVPRLTHGLGQKSEAGQLREPIRA